MMQFLLEEALVNDRPSTAVCAIYEIVYKQATAKQFEGAHHVHGNRRSLRIFIKVSNKTVP
jgi:hypothetical protein